MNPMTEKYDRVQIILHWLLAIILIGMIGLGLYMADLPKQSELPPGQESVRAFYFLLHKSIGLTAAILIAVRVLWRLSHEAPPLPDTLPGWQQKAAGLVHFALYLLMVAMPVSGYLQSMYSKYDTEFWGIALPRLADPDPAMRELFHELHETLATVFIILIVVHIAAAIKHRLEGTGIVERMLLK